MSQVPIDPIAIDVGALLQRTIASLYAHLVTRPTGRAVRLAIETRLAEARGGSLSLIDLSEVTLIDFSCADEVVAKLLLGTSDSRRPATFFVFGGVHEPHRDQIEAVLERQSLAAVAETSPGCYELLGVRSPEEEAAWRALEERGHFSGDQAPTLFGDPQHRTALDRLVERRLAFLSPGTGLYHSLSGLVQTLL